MKGENDILGAESAMTFQCFDYRLYRNGCRLSFNDSQIRFISIFDVLSAHLCNWVYRSVRPEYLLLDAYQKHATAHIGLFNVAPSVYCSHGSDAFTFLCVSKRLLPLRISFIKSRKLFFQSSSKYQRNNHEEDFIITGFVKGGIHCTSFLEVRERRDALLLPN